MLLIGIDGVSYVRRMTTLVSFLPAISLYIHRFFFFLLNYLFKLSGIYIYNTVSSTNFTFLYPFRL